MRVARSGWGEFAKWLSRRSGAHCRLLTETEWEHAARAGSATAFPWGETVGSRLANCAGCGSRWDGERSAPVGSLPLSIPGGSTT